MSTQENSNDSKKAAGYFKEKFTIGLSRITDDELSRAIMKCTSHKLKAPNDKHLERLVAATHGHLNEGSVKKHGDDYNHFIVHELEERSHTHNWVVVLKTMVTFHRLMMDGSVEVNKMMQNSRNLFCLRNIKDLTDSPEGAAQKRFIEQYICYLEERNHTQQRLAFNVRIESEDFMTAVCEFDFPTLRPAFHQLALQLERLSAIEFREVHVDNFCTLEGYKLLIQDGRRLFLVLSNRMFHVLSSFEELPCATKNAWLEEYRRYSSSANTLARLFNGLANANRHFGTDIPRLKEYPSTLLNKLEEDVKLSNIPVETLDLGDMDDVAEVVVVTQAVVATKKKPDVPTGGLSDDLFDLAVAPPPPQKKTMTIPTTVPLFETSCPPPNLDLFTQWGETTTTTTTPAPPKSPEKPPKGVSGGFDPFADVPPPAASKKDEVVDFFSNKKQVVAQPASGQPTQYDSTGRPKAW